MFIKVIKIIYTHIMEDIKNFLKTNRTNILFFALYIVVTVILMLNHEMWRDETQPWCLIRDCNFAEFFKILRIEGHPILWYLILFPLIKMGAGVISMQITGLVLSIAAVIYLLFKSPFKNLTKFFIIMSSAMLYFYPIVVRNFALIPIILFIMADIYPKRKEHPYWYSFMLILLSNTHFLTLCFCFINMLIFSAELILKSIKEKNYKDIFPIFPLLLNALYLYLFYHSALTESQSYYTYSHNTQPFFTAVQNFALMFFQYPFINPAINIILFYSIFTAVFVRLFIVNKQIFSILLFSFSAHFYIYYKVWFNGIVVQKAYLLMFLLLFCYLISVKIKKDNILNALIIIIFVINSIFSIYNVKFELQYNYSCAKETADYIKQNLNNENVFCTVGYPYLFTSISAYLPDKKLFSINENKYTSYYDFSRIKKLNNNKVPDCTYYIVQKTIKPAQGFEFLFESSEPVLSGMGYEDRESFMVYGKNGN